MLKNGKNKIKAFSLVEIIISLAIFSFIFSIVIGIALMLVRAQSKVQSQVFVTQTAQTLVNDMSQSLRYGYAYFGGDRIQYTNSGYKIRLENKAIAKPGDLDIQQNQNCIQSNGTLNCSLVSPDTEITNSQLVNNRQDSPFIVFESKDGDPYTYADQNAYCIGPRSDGTMTLYKLETFKEIETNGSYVEDFCNSSSKSAQDMIPDGINLDYVSFDVNGQSSENPTNPMVRVKLKLTSEIGGEILIQTTITQRLVQIL